MFAIILGALKLFIGPVFDFLNKRVDAAEQIHIVDTNALVAVHAAGMQAITKADSLNADVRKSEGNWGPTVLMMIAILTPLVWHEWQVILDSSRFIPAWGFAWGWLPYPSAAEHMVGSWKVAALPEPWGPVELSIFSSFFIGASAAVATIAVLKTIRR